MISSNELKDVLIKYLKKYGDDLVCVRYRADPENKRKLKTVEVVIEQSFIPGNYEALPLDKLISIRIEIKEGELRKKVRAAGGRWNRSKKVWELAYIEVLKLKLLDRIIVEQIK